MTSEEKKQDDLRRAGFAMLKRNPERVKTTRDLLMDNGDSEYREINIHDLIPNPHNKYPMTEIDELAESIRQFGLQQSIVVKPKGDGTYEINAGHRRHKAILRILELDEDKEYSYLLTQTCLVLSESEEDIITQIRKHITNTESRSLLQMQEDEKLAIIEDYIYWLDKARDNGLEVNGKPIKGKTRDLVAKRFGISSRTAQSLITKSNTAQGGKLATPPEQSDEEKKNQAINKLNKQLRKIYEQVEMISTEVNEKDIELIKTWLSDIESLI